MLIRAAFDLKINEFVKKTRDMLRNSIFFHEKSSITHYCASCSACTNLSKNEKKYYFSDNFTFNDRHTIKPVASQLELGVALQKIFPAFPDVQTSVIVNA